MLGKRISLIASVLVGCALLAPMALAQSPSSVPPGVQPRVPTRPFSRELSPPVLLGPDAQLPMPPGISDGYVGDLVPATPGGPPELPNATVPLDLAPLNLDAGDLDAGDLGVAPLTSPADFDFADLPRRSAGAVALSRSATPNLIGDLFNAGTSALGFSTRVSVSPDFSDPNLGFASTAPSFSSAAEVAAGQDAIISGLSVTALDRIGDVVAPNDSGFLDGPDIAPIDRVRVASNADASLIANVLQFGGSITAARPTSDASIFAAGDAAIARELSAGFADQIELDELLDLEYLEGDSSLLFDSSGNLIDASYVYRISAQLPVPSPGEVIGRYSIADNNSPMPTDRIFFDYNFFHNARITAVGIPVNRFSPGFEKTFADGNASIEFRAPMAVTLSSTVATDGDDLLAMEFGDVALAVKALLFQSDQFVLSVGLGLTLPTSDDFILELGDGVDVVKIENRTVRLLPYTAFSVRPTENTFIQSFAQFDFDTNGNEVFLDEEGFNSLTPGGLESVGNLRSQTTLRWSSSAGAFLLRRPRGKLSALAAVLESHYTATLNDAESVGSETFRIGDPNQSLNVMNVTTGLHAYFGKSVATVAYGTPVTSDRVFDGELRLFLNRYF